MQTVRLTVNVVVYVDFIPIFDNLNAADPRTIRSFQDTDQSNVG